jgi:hypothetical protein
LKLKQVGAGIRVLGHEAKFIAALHCRSIADIFGAKSLLRESPGNCDLPVGNEMLGSSFREVTSAQFA